MANVKMNFSLTQLEYVLAVHKHGHFAKAAAACHVTQPTLSMQIQKLEESLEVTLFDRSKKPVLLTDAGKALIQQFQTILFESRKIPDLLEARKDKQTSGTLTLAVIPTIAPYLLPRLLPQLEKQFPALKLEIKEMQTEQIIEALQSDELDVGLLATPLGLSQIQEIALYYEPFSVLSKKNHELAKLKKIHYSDLKFPDIWLLQEGHCLRSQILDVCALKQDRLHQRKYNFESGSLETLKNLVDSSGGYTLLPQLAAGNIGKNSVLIPFERPIPAREIGLVYRRKQYKSELIEAVGDAILMAIPLELKKLRPKDLEVLPVEQTST